MRSAALLALVAAAAIACTKAEPPKDEAALRGEDRPRLEELVERDVRASRAMREADDAARQGDAGAAVDLVETRAKPAVDEGLRIAEGAPMKSAWGTARKDELAALLRERKAEMPKYEDAVKSGDPEKMLGAIQAQATLERRAIAAVAAVKDQR